MSLFPWLLLTLTWLQRHLPMALPQVSATLEWFASPAVEQSAGEM